MKEQGEFGRVVSDDYVAAMQYLYSFINLEHKLLDRYSANKMDVTRMSRIMEHVGSPQQRFPSVHIAGSKGKGSVAAMCAACLRESGLKVGLFTSPHIKEFLERVRVLTPTDSVGELSEHDFVGWIDFIKAEVVPHFPVLTWFEILTTIGFLHFAREEVDIAVVEVGLGGRLDSTNVITPLVSVITSLSLEHTALLGDTIEQIAMEKGGIIKHGVPVVTAVQPPAALATLEAIAQERHAPLIEVGRDYRYEAISSTAYEQTIVVRRGEWAWPLTVSLAGAHQQENATVALAALHIIQSYFSQLTDVAIMRGMATASWPGRLQLLHQAEGTPTILLDGAHNYDSAVKLRQALTDTYQYENLVLIFGASADKDVSGMMRMLLPLAKMTIVTISDHPRAADPERLAQTASELGYVVETTATLETAVVRAWQVAGPNDLICVTGSLFVVGYLLNLWDNLKPRLPKTNESREL